MNGREFMVLSKVVWPNTPVIFLSADTGDLADHVIEQGAFAWVRKPYDAQHLLSSLRSAMQQSPEDRWVHMTSRLSG
jgi:two-component system, chemotaxis family, chemotaxis protein CheY